MSLLTILIVLIVIGIALWLINNYIPLDPKIKKILNIVVVIFVIICRHKSDLREDLIIQPSMAVFVWAEPKKDGRPPKNQGPWSDYKKRVWVLTTEVCHLIPGIENRGFKKDHIDHITSIWDGFKMGIPEHQIASIGNLRMLPYKENMRKGIKSLAKLNNQ